VVKDREYSNSIFEMVWNAAHHDPDYGEQHASVVASMHKIPITTLMKVVRHAQRTPKSVEWNRVSGNFT
jgi:hypothetical protein